MMKNDHRRFKLSSKWKFTALVFLVMFVFSVLLISVTISATISYLLFQAGIMPPIYGNRFPAILAFMMLASPVIGALLASIAGSYSLRPLRAMNNAMAKVTSGNFDVKVDESGPLELKRLAVSFNEMTKELSSIETLRSDFVSNISHEFKTPVVSIRGFAKLLKKNSLTLEQRDEYLDIIISESDRLTQLSSNVLLLSRLESTEKVIELTSFSLDEQIRRSILLLEPQFQRKQLELIVNLESVQMISNEEMLQHIWINLLSNAVKFSPEGGTITIELTSDENSIAVSISDSGIGMDEEVKKHIFDKFYQGDPSRSTEGSGLGLSLVKRILELTDGFISVESEPEKGTCFTVRFSKEESEPVS